jgi:hypothetical protein
MSTAHFRPGIAERLKGFGTLSLSLSAIPGLKCAVLIAGKYNLRQMVHGPEVMAIKNWVRMSSGFRWLPSMAVDGRRTLLNEVMAIPGLKCAVLIAGKYNLRQMVHGPEGSPKPIISLSNRKVKWSITKFSCDPVCKRFHNCTLRQGMQNGLSAIPGLKCAVLIAGKYNLRQMVHGPEGSPKPIIRECSET